MPDAPIECPHEDFHADVEVNRLTSPAGDDQIVVGFAADVTINCAQCGMPFRFVGVSLGLSPGEPRSSVDGTEIHLPILPCSGGDHRITIPALVFASGRRQMPDRRAGGIFLPHPDPLGPWTVIANALCDLRLGGPNEPGGRELSDDVEADYITSQLVEAGILPPEATR